MTGKLFGRTNANDRLFNIETQEGSDILEGDEGVASIGDATLQHIQDMNTLDRMAWEEYVVMGDGNIFRIEENLNWLDPDEFNLRNTDELSMYLKRAKIPEKYRQYYEDQVVAEKDRQESEDVMDHPEELIPYEDWERFPGMSKHWDIPSTPRPRAVYVGNARIPFYDNFSWGVGQGGHKDGEPHPMAKFIQRVIFTLDNFTWDEILTLDQVTNHNSNQPKNQIFEDLDSPSYIWTDGKKEYLIAEQYIEALRKRALSEKVDFKMKYFVYEELRAMILSIAAGKGDPTNVAEETLTSIERHWFNLYKGATVQKTVKYDPLYTFLCNYSKKQLKLAKSGKDVYNEVKKLGQQLYTHGFVTEKYFEDGELCRVRGRLRPECTKECTNPEHKAGKRSTVQKMKRHHWDKYYTLKKAIERLTTNKKRFTLGPLASKVIERIRVTKETSVKKNDFRGFTKIPNLLLKAQKSGKIELSKQEWDNVWAFYNSSKQEVATLATQKRMNND